MERFRVLASGRVCGRACGKRRSSKRPLRHKVHGGMGKAILLKYGVGLKYTLPGCLNIRRKNCILCTCCRQKNAIVSPHIHSTWVGYLSPALYVLQPLLKSSVLSVYMFGHLDVRYVSFIISHFHLMCRQLVNALKRRGTDLAFFVMMTAIQSIRSFVPN